MGEPPSLGVDLEQGPAACFLSGLVEGQLKAGQVEYRAGCLLERIFGEVAFSGSPQPQGEFFEQFLAHIRRDRAGGIRINFECLGAEPVREQLLVELGSSDYPFAGRILKLVQGEVLDDERQHARGSREFRQVVDVAERSHPLVGKLVRIWVVGQLEPTAQERALLISIEWL